jgi:hypothetical protein
MTPDNTNENPEIPSGVEPNQKADEAPGKYFNTANLKNAAPAFLIAVAYAVAGLGKHPILGFDGKMLGGLLLVEFFAVFFGFFILAMIIALQKNRSREMRVRISATLGFTIAVAIGLSFIAGPWGPFFLVLATMGTYWGTSVRWYNREGISNSVVRAFINLALYGFWVLLAFHPEQWKDLFTDTIRTHIAGMVYFFSLGILEWSGDMDN